MGRGRPNNRLRPIKKRRPLIPGQTTVPVPIVIPVGNAGGGVTPKLWFTSFMKVLNPVPKLVLNAFGAVPKPMKPLPNPLLNPELKVAPASVGPKMFGKLLVGRSVLGVGLIPKKLLRGVLRVPKPLLNAVEMFYAKLAALVVVWLGIPRIVLNRAPEPEPKREFWT
jgi:hypothetical protein